MKRIINNYSGIIKLLFMTVFAICFGNGLHELILAVDHSEDITVFPLGTLMCLLFLFGFMIYVNVFDDASRFSRTISLGCTRREYFLGRIFELVVELLVAFLLAYGCNEFEKWKFAKFYPNIRVELDMTPFFQLKYVVPVLFIFGAISFTASILVLKFGTKALMGLWLVFMFVCIGVPRIIEQASKHVDFSKLIDLFGDAWYLLAGIIIVISVILILIDRKMILKQAVNS